MILFNKLFLGLDGRYFTRLVTEKIQWPNALTVDYTTDRVYWGDAREDRIESVSWNGTNRSAFLAFLLSFTCYIVSICIYRVIFLSDACMEHICYCKKYHSTVICVHKCV